MPELKYRTYPIDRKSDAYRRMTIAGFTIEDVKVAEDLYSNSLEFRCDFQCVCGRPEVFYKRMLDYREMSFSPYMKTGKYDVALELERIGAISEEHLKQDGFDEDTIRKIRMPYDLQEAEGAIRVMADIVMAYAPEVMESVLRRYPTIKRMVRVSHV